MATKAEKPLKTYPAITERGRQTYSTIAARLADLHPKIRIEEHIAQREDKGMTEFSTLEARDNTLDGINFRAVDPKKLAAEFHDAVDRWGLPALASMKENPDHWALKASFGKTIGTGWREAWRPAPYHAWAAIPPEPDVVDDR